MPKKIPKLEIEDNLAEESDSSDEETKVRIGDVPFKWYEEYDHFGYDIYGQKVVKKAQKDALDRFLDAKENWRTIHDPLNNEDITLTDEELRLIRQIRKGRPISATDISEEIVYEAPKEVTALGDGFEPKRRFIPSKWEAKKIVKMVHSIRNGWLIPPSQRKEKDKVLDEEDDNIRNLPDPYLLWGEDGKADIDPHKGPPAIPPPKPALPGHNESFNPPPEYLLTQDEVEAWEMMDPSDRQHDFIPQKYESFRHVPAYSNLIKERFERCLDLYLCPRAKRKRLNINPQDLIPKLPKPEDLRPFPTALCLEYLGHTDKVRSISVSPCGQWLASGSDDGTIRIWEVETTRCFKCWRVPEVVDVVAWNPNPEFPLLAVGTGTRIILYNTETGSSENIKKVETLLSTEIPVVPGETKAALAKIKWNWQVEVPIINHGQSQELKDEEKEDPLLDPILNNKPGEEKEKVEGSKPEKIEKIEIVKGEVIKEEGDVKKESEEMKVKRGKKSQLILELGSRVKDLVWHEKGDYFATVSPEVSATSVLIHRLTKQQTQAPFSKAKGMIQRVAFHPSRPVLYVASQRQIRAYNLAKQQLMKTLKSNCKWISSISIHPTGDHVIVGSYDRKFNWFDMDLSSLPYKTIRSHRKAIRGVHFHPSYPLFASASDDGNLHIFHSTVYSDLMTNPLIVPVKIIEVQSPQATDQGVLGLLSCHFHPNQPWIFTSGSDGVVRLFT